MKQIRFSLPVLVLVMLTCTVSLEEDVAASATVLPLGLMENEFVYDRAERTDALNLERFDFQLGPYDISRLPSSLEVVKQLRDISASDLLVFGFASEDLRSSDRGRAQSWEQVRGGLAARPDEHVFVYGSFILDEQLAHDDQYTGKVWRGLAGDVQDAFVRVTAGALDLTAGRFSSFWGLRRSLVFSPQQELDGLMYTLHWKRLTISYRLARLEETNPGTDSLSQFDNRYLAAHRLDIHFSNRLRVGLFETVIFGGPGRQIELFYLNPILFYHGAQLNENTDDNTFLGFDFSFKPREGINLYGQLMVDDFQIDHKTRADQEPNEIAMIAGSYLADVASGMDIRVEYTRVTNRTFNQILPRNRYTYKGKPIGSVRGNDYDLLDLDVIRWFGERTSATASVQYYRQGTGRISDPWTEPWLLATGDYSEEFPTGTVERVFTASLGAASFTAGQFFVEAETGLNRITNFNNRLGDNRTSAFFNLKASVFFFSSIGLE